MRVSFGKSSKEETLKTERGFTLIEVLISIFIFSLISVGSVGALTAALQGKARLNQSLEAIADIQHMRALLSADMNSIVLRQNRDVLGSLDPVVLSGGTDALFAFTRANRENPGFLAQRSDLQRVFYSLEDGALIRRVVTHENPAPQAQIRDRILLTGLKHADIMFHTDKQVQDRIEINFGATEALPDMIELHLVFDTGDEITQYFELSL